VLCISHLCLSILCKFKWQILLGLFVLYLHTYISIPEIVSQMYICQSTFNNTGVSKHFNTTSTTNYFVQFVLCPNFSFFHINCDPIYCNVNRQLPVDYWFATATDTFLFFLIFYFTFYFKFQTATVFPGLQAALPV